MLGSKTMKPTLLAALCAMACAGPTAALAQDEDDWEFQHEASLNQTVAAVRYDAGVAIVVQCRDNALSAALVGMPAGVGGFEVQARRADGRTDTQTWAPGPQTGVFLSTVPARDIRFMRGGGLYSVRTPDGATPMHGPANGHVDVAPGPACRMRPSLRHRSSRPCHPRNAR
jgi:hypothetical protein